MGQHGARNFFCRSNLVPRVFSTETTLGTRLWSLEAIFPTYRWSCSLLGQKLQEQFSIENAGFPFVWTKNILKTMLFENDDVTITIIFPARVFLKHKSKMTVINCCIFKFLRRSVDGKPLMRFQSETSVVKLLRPSLDGAFTKIISWVRRGESLVTKF